jgi:hypothetical protein
MRLKSRIEQKSIRSLSSKHAWPMVRGAFPGRMLAALEVAADTLAKIATDDQNVDPFQLEDDCDADD